MQILFFQYGDFGEAFRRFAGGEPETYRDQRQSVDFVAALRHDHRVTTVAICDRPHREDLAPGLTSIGISQDTADDPAALAALLGEVAPDLLVARTPHLGLLRWSARRALPTLPVFADIFANRGPRPFAKNMMLRRALTGPHVPCVANHSLNASRSLARALFLPETRIIPWDWSRLAVEPRPKPAAADSRRPTAFYAGLLSESKGVGDCLVAVAELARRGIVLSFDFAGPGDAAPWRARAGELGIADRVRFPGRLAHAEVRARMRAADITVVPSRHDYPEGLPNTIYESLAARSPLVISDHPAFAGRLRDGAECLVFPAGDGAALAGRLAALAADPVLYARLSANAAAAHDRLYLGTEWTRLIAAFLADPANRGGWVAPWSLARLRRDGQVPEPARPDSGGQG